MATRTEPVITLPPPLAFALGVPAAPRSAVEAVIERMIDALDTIDGDPDFQQDDGDSEDGNASEDEFMEHGCDFGPGCPVADPGGGNAEDEYQADGL